MHIHVTSQCFLVTKVKAQSTHKLLTLQHMYRIRVMSDVAFGNTIPIEFRQLMILNYEIHEYVN